MNTKKLLLRTTKTLEIATYRAIVAVSLHVTII